MAVEYDICVSREQCIYFCYWRLVWKDGKEWVGRVAELEVHGKVDGFGRRRWVQALDGVLGLMWGMRGGR